MRLVLYVIAALAFTFSVSAQNPSQATSQTQPSPSANESTQETNDRYMRDVLKSIAGHEQEPAEKVFKNVKIMKQAPAERFLRIMNLGYAKALGVTCEHCHVTTDFSSDEKRPKRAAREMAEMHHDINERLNKMQNLAPKEGGHFINCSTCHRGTVDPTKQ